MNRGVLSKILKYLKKDIITVVASIIFSIITVIFTIYTPILFGQAIDLIIEKNNVFIDKIIDILFKAFILILLTSLLQFTQMYLNNKMAYRITRRLRKECFGKIQVLPLKYLDNHSSGATLNIIISDIDLLSEGLLLGFTQFFTGVATIIGTIVFMLYINWFIALIVIVVTPLSLFVARFITKNTYDMFKLQSLIKARQTGFIDEMISNLKVVEAYNHEDENLEQFDKVNKELETCSLKATFFSSLTNPCTRFVNSVVYALVALFGAIFVINPFIPGITFTIGLLTTFLSYANQYTKPFNEISSVFAELQNALACASRVFELLDEEELTIEDEEIGLIEGNVKLENIYFSYDENIKLIEDFNLSVEKGKHVAIVGPTGCGKTTLINLLMRFYDPISGNIKVDGVNIKDVSRKSLRDNYGMVLQDTWIKNATVKENITLGNKFATLEEVIDACKKAHCHSFIKKLPKGYDTVIKDDGMLSAGQKQLISIARIMLLLPPMLILDEATSSIDTRTELKIQEAFATLMKGKTTFIVAHRLSTIKEADIILVMNNGNIIEQGSHEELLDKKGFYYNLYNAQFNK